MYTLNGKSLSVKNLQFLHIWKSWCAESKCQWCRPRQSLPSPPPPGGSEVPPPIREKYQRVRFSSNENQITPIHLLNKRSHGVHLTRTSEPPWWPPPGQGGTWQVKTHFRLDFHGTKSKWIVMAYNVACKKSGQKVPPWARSLPQR